VDRALPGMPRRRADMLFPGVRVAVFVDGCFWHSCPQHASVPRANQQWWIDKLRRNVDRDRETDARLEALGWTVLRFWEHEDPARAVDVVETTVRARQRQYEAAASVAAPPTDLGPSPKGRLPGHLCP
jgi:DNA mismatch endonuclease (patch repair protein)